MLIVVQFQKISKYHVTLTCVHNVVTEIICQLSMNFTPTIKEGKGLHSINSNDILQSGQCHVM